MIQSPDGTLHLNEISKYAEETKKTYSPHKTMSMETNIDMSPVNAYNEDIVLPVSEESSFKLQGNIFNGTMLDLSSLKDLNKEHVNKPTAHGGDTLLKKISCEYGDLKIDRDVIIEQKTMENLSPENENNIIQEVVVASRTQMQRKSLSDHKCEGDQKDNFLSVGDIIEFDRSDNSSDSEGETTRRMRGTRRTRISKEEISKEITEIVAPPAEVYNAKTFRRRRSGVSAEPMRASWSTIRETLKASQVDLNVINSDIDGGHDSNVSNKG